MAREARASADDLESLLEFETLVSDLSSRFINLPPSEVDRAIEDGLRRVCERLDLDHAMLWQWSAGAPRVITPTHTYIAANVPRPSPLQAQEYYPWCVQQILAGRTIAFASLEELPAEAAVDREFARRNGVRSSLTLPLAVGGEPQVGALAFNALRVERDWPEVLVKRLQLVAQVFTNALARKRYELNLRESEERLSLAADSAEAGLWTLDYGTGVFWATERARKMIGYTPDEVVDVARFAASVHPDDRDLIRRAIERAARAGEPVNEEYRIVLPGDRSVRWIASRGRPQFSPTGQPERLTGVSIDITERKRAEIELRDLSARLIRAHEEERAQLARELHDDLTQRLAVLAIDVGRAERAAPEGAQAETLRAIREGLSRLSEDVHSLAYQLHPSVLDELGLTEALRTECERIGRRGGVKIALALDPPIAVSARDAALCLFRVAQEALTNVIRHAGAQTATVVLRKKDGGLMLAVCDDGAGFDPGSPRRGRSLGLASMRERVRLVNGTLDIESAPGRGTAIVAWVPAEGEPR